MSRYFDPTWFGAPAQVSTPLAEAERTHLDQALDVVHDHLRIAVVDASGRRIKNSDANRALKLLGRL